MSGRASSVPGVPESAPKQPARSEVPEFLPKHSSPIGEPRIEQDAGAPSAKPQESHGLAAEPDLSHHQRRSCDTAQGKPLADVASQGLPAPGPDL